MGENKKTQEMNQAQQAEQERMFRMSLIEQEARQLEQQLQLIERQIVELQVLKLNLNELEKAKPKDEMLSSMGRNIFVKTSLISKDLWVDIGAKTVAKKSVSETKGIIDKDIDKLIEARNGIAEQLQQIVNGLQKVS